MSRMIRSPKSGSDWTSQELQAFNIKVTNCSFEQFFGHDIPESSPSIEDLQDFEGWDPKFLDCTKDSPDLSKNTHRLLRSLHLASYANDGQESAIDDVAKDVLRLVGFEDRPRLFRSRFAIPLHICGEMRSAHANVCLVHRNATILMVLQENKVFCLNRNCEPQMIAAAIAAFQYNNTKRYQLGKSRLSSMVIPCILMIQTRPVFYQIPVSIELSECVISGEFPSFTTNIQRCIVAPISQQYLTEGMESPRFRAKALKYYVAFKALAKELWLPNLI